MKSIVYTDDHVILVEGEKYIHSALPKNIIKELLELNVSDDRYVKIEDDLYALKVSQSEVSDYVAKYQSGSQFCENGIYSIPIAGIANYTNTIRGRDFTGYHRQILKDFFSGYIYNCD